MVPVVRGGRGGEQILHGPADVGEVGGPVAAYVGEEGGGREAAAQRHGRTAGQRRSPTGDHRVAVEHRHTEVVDVVPAHSEESGGRVSGGGQPALGAEGCLGRAGGAGGEVEEHPGGGRRGTEATGAGGDLVGRRALVRPQQFPVGRVVHDEDPLGRDGEVQAGQQRQVGAFGDQQRAVGMADVAGELRPATGGIDPGDRGPGECRRAQPQRILGHIAEQHPEVRLRIMRQQLPQ